MSTMDDREETQARMAVPAWHADELDGKLAESFPGLVVRKDLTGTMRRAFNVPTYVLEYLLGMYCASDDEAAVAEGLTRIRRVLTECYAKPDDSEVIKSRIRERGAYTVIDKVSAFLDEADDCYAAEMANLAIEPFAMPDDYVRSYEKLLSGGIWCRMRIEYLRPDGDGDEGDDVFATPGAPRPRSRRRGGRRRRPQESPFRVASLKPIQMPNFDLERVLAARADFSRDEWERVLLRSAGYEPDAMEPRVRMHFLMRMVPLVEHNYNLCELGPRGTGKTYVYQEVSPYAYVISGGSATTASIFGSLTASSSRGGLGGLVAHWDAVTFDEVAGMHYKDVHAIQVMKDYMANGSYARGRDQFSADASLVFEGNINQSVAEVLKTTHLFDPFPPEFNDDAAFFDRIHCYLPGWELPKMSASLITEHCGLITDCLSEFCHAMRARDYTHLFDEWFRLNDQFNRRDETAVRKTFAGLAKLLYPDGRMEKEDARELLEYAIEGRRRVKEQLKIMAGVEFMDVALGYTDVDTREARVMEVPERPDVTLVPEASLPAGHVFAVGRSVGGEWAVYRLESRCTAGAGAFDTEGLGSSRKAKESARAAFDVFESTNGRVALGMRADERDFATYFKDLQEKGASDEVSLAEYVSLCSAACRRPVLDSLVVPGALRISGTLDALTGLEDIMRLAANAGARRVLLPTDSIEDYGRVPADLMTRVSPVFYEAGDAAAAARAALGLVERGDGDDGR